MAVKIFVLGLPGSGKSTVVRYISKYAKDNAAFVKSTGNKNREVRSLSCLKKLVRFLTTFKEQSNKQWSTTHINDYAILYKMFQGDTKGQFKPADAKYGGFDVLDLAVFDTALRKLEQKVTAHISAAKQKEIVLIEFSRNDYEKAFQQFSHEFLQDASFLYLNVDLEICKRRIRERITHPATSDDHFVSEYIFDAYYSEDDGQAMPQILKRDFGIDKQQVKIIDNNCSLGVASKEINSFIDLLMDSVPTLLNTTGMPVNSSSGELTDNDAVDGLANESGKSEPDHIVDAEEIPVGVF